MRVKLDVDGCFHHTRHVTSWLAVVLQWAQDSIRALHAPPPPSQQEGAGGSGSATGATSTSIWTALSPGTAVLCSGCEATAGAAAASSADGYGGVHDGQHLQYIVERVYTARRCVQRVLMQLLDMGDCLRMTSLMIGAACRACAERLEVEAPQLGGPQAMPPRRPGHMALHHGMAM